MTTEAIGHEPMKHCYYLECSECGTLLEHTKVEITEFFSDTLKYHTVYVKPHTCEEA